MLTIKMSENDVPEIILEQLALAQPEQTYLILVLEVSGFAGSRVVKYLTLDEVRMLRESLGIILLSDEMS
jgi:hypothetical protein